MMLITSQLSTNDYRAVWNGFHDPHSHMDSYFVSVGKCKGCDDVMQESKLGLLTGTV